jgi:hypothetical protein
VRIRHAHSKRCAIVTETELQDAIVAMMRLFRWRVVHHRPALTSKGWRTAIQGDVGWPDLFACRGDRAIAAELKSGRGILTPGQDLWLKAMRAAGIEVHLWRPEHWRRGEIERVLR